MGIEQSHHGTERPEGNRGLGNTQAGGLSFLDKLAKKSWVKPNAGEVANEGGPHTEQAGENFATQQLEKQQITDKVRKLRKEALPKQFTPPHSYDNTDEDLCLALSHFVHNRGATPMAMKRIDKEVQRSVDWVKRGGPLRQEQLSSFSNSEV